MAVRASDSITLVVLPSISYVRTYYLLQNSTLAVPAKPTPNPPQSPWTATEPSNPSDATNTLYTVQLTLYSNGSFDYADVQKDSAYETAKSAFNLATQANSNAATANGRLTVSTAAPLAADGAGKPSGAVWFRRDGSNRFIGAWEWTGAAWTARTIENAMIATLDAAKINTGFLDVANRVRAGAITTSKVAISDFTNYLAGGAFDTADDLSNWSGGIGAIVTDVVSASAGALRVDGGASGRALTQNIAVRAGQRWRIAYSVITTDDYNGTGSNGKLRLGDQGGAQKVSYTWPKGTTWRDLVQEFVIPEGQTSLQVRLVFDHSLGSIWIDNFEARLMNAGELIVDGGILAKHLKVDDIWANQAFIDMATLNVLKAGVIEVGMLSSQFAQQLDISSNAAVNIIVNQQQEMSAQVAAAQQQLDSTDATAQAAAAAAETAQAGVSQVAGQVESVASAQAATQQQVSNLQTWFRVDSEGAHVGATGSAFQTHVKPDRFEITDNGRVATTWSAGRMQVAAIDADEMSLPGFKFEAYGTGMVVRALGT